MGEINKLYEEIEDLNKKIKEESRKKIQRSLRIDDEIEKLEDDKRRAGFRREFSEVSLFNSKIKLLKEEKSKDYVFEYKEKIKFCKIKIQDIIVGYYSDGYVIEDIFEKEDINQNIREEWLNKSDFGKNTGYLFVEMIENDDEHIWRYINPITDFEIKSKNIDDLKNQINKSNQISLIFDDKLMEKSINRDRILFQKVLDDYIEKLKSSDSDKDEIFSYFRKYSDKFSENQIGVIYEFLIGDINNYCYLDDFIYILVSNSDRFDNAFFDRFYEGIIDYGLKTLKNVDYYYKSDVEYCLEKCADKFTKNQIIELFEIIDYIDDFTLFGLVLEENADKFDDNYLSGLYGEVIDIGISRLHDADYSFEMRDIFQCLESYGDKFTKKQLYALYDFIIEDMVHYNEFNRILSLNEDTFGEEFIEKVYFDLIDEGINKLKITTGNVSDIFKYLKSYSDYFSQNQLNALSKTIIENAKSCYFAREFKYILESNEVNSIKKIYNNLINSRINIINDLNDISGPINDLRYFTNYFTKKQFNKLCEIIVNNHNINNFANDFNYIVEFNAFDIDENKIYGEIIDNRIQFISENECNSIPDNLFKDLSIYADNFNQTQIRTFYDLVKEKNLPKFYGKYILPILNKNKFDDGIEGEIIKIKIDLKLDELERLRFGYSDARIMLQYLEDYRNDFSKLQMDRLCEISIKNSQVYNCYVCESALKRIIYANKDIFDEKKYGGTYLKGYLDND